MKYKTIFKIVIGISAVSLLYINAHENKVTSIDTNSTIKEVVKETNFKLDFKNINELEYIMQDDIINYNNNNEPSKTFSKNNKFNILTLDTDKISSISYTSSILEMSNSDMDYLQKIYSFVFDNISSYLFDKTNELVQKMQSNEYIDLNKHSIKSNGYYKETIDLNKTSEIQITTYYQHSNNELIPYKVSIDILRGNKW